MELLVIRHAIAEDRQVWARTGRDDGQRPLTKPGIERMERAARGLRGLVEKLDLLATSPLTRAVQTARIVSDAFGGPTPVEVDALAGGGQQEVLDWLREQGETGVAAIVGHEPDLGDLISWLLSNQHHGFVELKKGAACLLAFPGRVAPGAARLRWALPPRALRELAEAGSDR